MGFEVLDSRGTATGRPGDVSPAPVDVVQLDDSSAATDPPPRIDRRATAWVGALVVVALALGAGLGGLAVRRHERDQQRQAQNAVLSVSAVFSNLSPADTGVITTASVVVDLKNYGPVPVRVVTTTNGQQERFHVRLFTSPREVAPGGTAQVSMSVPIDCGGQNADPRITVPMMTRDQLRHEVPIELKGMSLRGYFCSGQTQNIQAVIVGPITRPLLRLRNDSDVDLEFTRSGTIGPVEFIGPLITVSTQPDMPVRVRARTSLDVQLVVKARRCLGDISLLSGASYLNIDSADTDTESIPASTGVDVAALVGAAVAKACAKR